MLNGESACLRKRRSAILLLRKIHSSQELLETAGGAQQIGLCNRWQRRPGKCVRLVQGPLGPLLQITPRALTDALAAGGAEARREFEAMMSMEKIDVATIEAVRRG